MSGMVSIIALPVFLAIVRTIFGTTTSTKGSSLMLSMVLYFFIQSDYYASFCS